MMEDTKLADIVGGCHLIIRVSKFSGEMSNSRQGDCEISMYRLSQTSWLCVQVRPQLCKSTGSVIIRRWLEAKSEDNGQE